MILKGSQHGEAAAHLLKAEDNEHFEIHELKGLVAEDLPGALQEICAISRGSRYQQYLFSGSYAPCAKQVVPCVCASTR